jgi:hypothetical protein
MQIISNLFSRVDVIATPTFAVSSPLISDEIISDSVETANILRFTGFFLTFFFCSVFHIIFCVSKLLQAYQILWVHLLWLFRSIILLKICQYLSILCPIIGKRMCCFVLRCFMIPSSLVRNHCCDLVQLTLRGLLVERNDTIKSRDVVQFFSLLFQ